MIISVVGCRPQYIKYAVIEAELKRQKIDNWGWIDTKQHYDYSVSGTFYDTFKLSKPVVTAPSTGLSFLIPWLEDIFRNASPNMVIVYGDTDTTLAGALAAKRANIPLAHVESWRRAGRFDLPEETNRVVADALADMKLDMEGGLHLEALNLIEIELPKDAGEYYLMDLHRNYNIDDTYRFNTALESASQLNKPVKFIIHHRMPADFTPPKNGNLKVLPTQSYADMIKLIRGAIKVITDSGGVQREAYALKVPCITIRPSTEWAETLHDGCNILCEPNDIEKTVAAMVNPTWRNYFAGGVAKDIIKEVNEWVNGA